LGALHPAFDWLEVARLVLTSRYVDELEEQELVPQGYINYQFSARGHELGQVLLSQLMTRPLTRQVLIIVQERLFLVVV